MRWVAFLMYKYKHMHVPNHSLFSPIRLVELKVLKVGCRLSSQCVPNALPFSILLTGWPKTIEDVSPLIIYSSNWVQGSSLTDNEASKFVLYHVSPTSSHI